MELLKSYLLVGELLGLTLSSSPHVSVGGRDVERVGADFSFAWRHSKGP